MNTRLLLAVALLIVTGTQQSYAQCSASISKTGSGCVGDSLKLTISGGTQIQWKRGTHVIKTVSSSGTSLYGNTVAGQKKFSAGSSDSAHLFYPFNTFVDAAGNVYVADKNNNRVQKWAPGAKYGVTVAGQKNGTSGTDSFHLKSPSGVYVDAGGNVYVADYANNRVQKWTPGAKYGITVAGKKNGSYGNDSANLYLPTQIYVDASGNVYIADQLNNRVQKWAPGAKYGTTVAGSKKGTAGTDSAHLQRATGVYVDASGNVYVADQFNNRIQKWAPGAKYGITVAGQKAGTSGNDSLHFNYPTGVFVDASGNIYVADQNNHRVQKWAAGSGYGITVAGEKNASSGRDSLHLYNPSGVFVDSIGNIYVADQYNYRIQKWSQSLLTGTYRIKTDSLGSYSAMVTFNGGCSATSNSILLSGTSASSVSAKICSGSSYSFNSKSYTTAGVFYDTLTNKAGCDSIVTLTLTLNTAVLTHTGNGCKGDTLKLTVNGASSIVWKRGSTTIKTTSGSSATNYGITVAGQKNGVSGSDSMHLNGTTGVFTDASGNVYVAEFNNNRVQKWAPGAKYGVTVAGQKSGVGGSDSIHLNNPNGVYVDSAGNVYVADCHNNRVQRWTPGAKYGVTVAGHKNTSAGTDSTSLYYPVGIYLDRLNNIYIVEYYNHRVQKWAIGSKYGVTVAGQKNCSSGSDSMHLSNPCGVWLDANANIYIGDATNNRVQKWVPGAKYGTTVAGQKNGTTGTDSTHLNQPRWVFVDASGNVFVSEFSNHRVQKWAPGAKYGTTVAGHKSGTLGTDSTGLYYPSGIYYDINNNLYVADFNNNRVQKWAGSSNLTGTYTYIADSVGTYTAVVTFNSCSVTSNSITIKSNSSSTVSASVCANKSYSFNGSTYNVAGTFTAKKTNKAGCDSIITLNLTVNTTSNVVINKAICSGNTYSFNGKSLSTAGVYHDTLTNKAGCDSMNTLNLTVNTAVLTHTGNDCKGDTLKLSVNGASSIVWKRGSTTIKTTSNSGSANYGITVAGQKNTTTGTDSTELGQPASVIEDAAGNLYVADWNNNRVQKWAPGAKYGVTVAGDKNGTAGTDSAHLNNPYFMSLDSAGNLYVVDCHNNRVQRWAPGAKYGVTVAGQKSTASGSDSAHLYGPVGIYVDRKQNVYVAEDQNRRVQKWAPGAKYGVTVAGQKNCTAGTDSAHLSHPYGLWLDNAGNIFVADVGNNRIQKWAPGANYGTTVAGDKNGSYGADSLHLNNIRGVFVDASDNVYITDAGNSRVQKWAPGAKYGITVAGHKNGTYGTDSTSLFGGTGVFVDASNNLFVADNVNNRVQKWALGPSYLSGTYTYVTDSAGTYTAVVNFNGCSVTSNSITIKANSSTTINAAICANKSYSFNGSTYTVAGTYTAKKTNKAGCDSIITLNLTVNTTSNVVINQTICSGNTYSFNGKSLSTAGVYHDTLTNKAGCDSMNTLNLAVNTASITHTGAGCVGDTLKLTSSTGATNIVWKRGSTVVKSMSTAGSTKYGITVAGQKNTTTGTDSTELGQPASVIEDAAGNLYVADWNNNRVQKWAPGAKYGVTVAGDKNGTAGTDSAHLNNPYFMSLDSAGNLYVVDCHNNRVQRWAPGAKYGVTVAGQKSTASGSDSAHLYGPVGIYVDRKQNVYVAEDQNRRVQKWAPGAKYGVTVAGQKNCTAGTDSAHLSHPYGLWLDNAGNIFVADVGNNRIQKWAPGAKYGTTVAGDKNGSYGADSLHLNDIRGVFVDASDNVYITDAGNSRVQKWAPGAKYGITVAGHKNGTYGTDSTSLFGGTGVFVDASNNLFVADNVNNRVQKWALGSGSTSYVADSAGTYTTTVTFASGCSVTTNSIIIGKPTGSSISASICQGKSYSFNGSTYTAAGTYTAKHTNKAGCDSTVTLNLTVKSKSATSVSGSVCLGKSYNFNGKNYSVAGTYLDTLTNKLGCDSVVTLHLTVTKITHTVSASICPGGSYSFNGKNYSTAGSYLDTLTSHLGCDSIVTLSLTVKHTSTGTVTASTCPGVPYVYHTKSYSTAGTYTDTLTNKVGCDSVVTINLTLTKLIAHTINASTCSGTAYMYNGKSYSTAGTYTDTISNKAGCDSLVTINLTVNTATSSSVNAAICAGSTYTFHTKSFTVAGTYLDTLTNSKGCDSIVTITLVVNTATTGTVSASTCSGKAYMFHGKSYSTAGAYMDTLTNTAGCDSVVTINLTVIPISSSTVTASTCAGTPYMFHSKSYSTAGAYMDTLTNTAGCDSVVTINLTVKALSYTTQSATICYGKSYTFNGKTYSASGSYTDTFTNSLGCDSLVTLTLTVNSPITTTVNGSTCMGTAYSFNGKSYTVAGSYADTLTSHSGCDSVVTLNLVINKADSATINSTICSGSSYMLKGKSYTTAGTYIDTLTNSHGCDSIVTLNLAVNTVGYLTLNDTIHSGKSIVINGKTYTTAGSFSDTLYYKSTHCDSVILTINITVVTGINTIAEAKGHFIVSPNPNDGNFNISLVTTNHIDKAYIQVVNILGQTVAEQTAGNNNGTVSTRIADNKIAAGVYFVRVSLGHDTYTTRVVISH